MKKIINLFVLLLIISGISSCVEEDPFFDPEDVENVIEFKSAGNVQSGIAAPYPLFFNSYEEADASNMEIVVSYSGADVAPTDITVNIGLGTQAMLDAYNESEETEYELMPAELYTLPASVTIPRGERTATYTVTIKTNQLDFTKSFAIPLSITSASSGIVSGNFSSAIFGVGVKNVMDGVYNYKTSATTALVPNADKTVSLVTTGANTVKLDPGLLGTYSNEVIYTLDPATNKITVSMTTLLPIATDPSSYYDPATRSFHLKWTSNGGSRKFEETFTYIGPRD